jgi:hypothetical protein
MKHQWHYERQAQKINKRAEAAISVISAIAFGAAFGVLIFIHLSK